MRIVLVLTFALALALAGCTGSNDNNGTPSSSTPASSTPASSTPASSTPASSTPASSTPASSTPVGSTPVSSTPVSSTPVTPGGNTTTESVSWVGTQPTSGPAGGVVNLCWRANGTGTSVHTALHTDTVSHANEAAATFSTYAGDAYYPANQQPTLTGQFDLPGIWCASVTLPANGTLYVRPHTVFTGLPGTLGPELAIATGAGNATAQGTVRAVYVVSAPENVTAGQDANVCWRVEGTGTIAHTAIHWDIASHPNATAFSEYPNAIYRNNGPATLSGNFQLPGVFCAAIRQVNQTVHFRAHALTSTAALPGQLSTEQVITVGAQTVDFTEIPEVAGAGTNVSVCWSAPALTGSSVHTAVHWDTVSHPNATSFSVYPNAIYPNNGPATTSGSFATPGPFCANLTMPASGAVYMVAHIVPPGGSLPGTISVERSIAVAPRVSLVGAVPESAPAGGRVTLCWRAEGTFTSVHTALHTSATSHATASNATFQSYEGTAYYPSNGPATVTGSFHAPGPWCAELTMPASGTLYVVPHVVVTGLPGELGQEVAIRVA